MAVASPHISLAAESFTIAGVTVSNALLTTWIVMAVLVILSVLATKKLKNKPGRGQMLVELLVGGLFSFFEKLGGSHGKTYAPLAVTLFLFIVLSNWAGLIPGVGTIGFFEEGKEHATKIIQRVVASTPVTETAVSLETTETEAVTTAEEHAVTSEGEQAAEAEHTEAAAHTKFVPLFRGPTADLNLTIALALIAFGAIQFYGFKLGGFNYLTKFINISSPIGFFVGILEILSDLSKIASFAFRLFGNVFAGEVLLTVMAFLPLALVGLPPFFLPIPFYLLELFVGVIQGLVFAMLTVVFINVAVSHAEHVAHEKAHKKLAHAK